MANLTPLFLIDVHLETVTCRRTYRTNGRSQFLLYKARDWTRATNARYAPSSRSCPTKQTRISTNRTFQIIPTRNRLLASPQCNKMAMGRRCHQNENIEGGRLLSTKIAQPGIPASGKVATSATMMSRCHSEGLFQRRFANFPWQT